MRNQDFVAPALCHTPLWAAGLVTPFVAPALRHMPMEVVSVRVRESTRMKKECLLKLCLGQNGERCSRHSEAEWENEGIRGRPKADQRAQWNQGRDEQANFPRVRVNNDNWEVNQLNSQGKDDYSVQRFNSEQEIAIWWRYSSILNHESTTSRVNVRGQRKSEKRKGLVKNKMVGSGAKRGLCQCHRLLWSSCDVWACDQLSVALRSVESLSLFFNGRKVMQLDKHHSMVAWVLVKSLEI